MSVCRGQNAEVGGWLALLSVCLVNGVPRYLASIGECLARD